MMDGQKFAKRILIVIFTVCSVGSVFGGDDSYVRNTTLSYKEYRNVYAYNRTYQDCLVPWFRFWCKTKVQTIYRNEFLPVTVTKEICYSGYENRSGICRPQCVPPCAHGYCSEPNNCTCDENWHGQSCNNTFLCSVPWESAMAERVSKDFKTMVTETKNSDIEMKDIVKCRPECKAAVSNEVIISYIHTKEYLHILVANDSACNTSESPRISGIFIITGAAIGVSLSIVSFGCIICFLGKRTKEEEPIHNESEPGPHKSVRIPIGENTPVINNPSLGYEFKHDEVLDGTSIIESRSQIQYELPDYVSMRTIKSYSHLSGKPKLYPKPKPQPTDQGEDYDYVHVSANDQPLASVSNQSTLPLNTEPISDYDDVSRCASYITIL